LDSVGGFIMADIQIEVKSRQGDHAGSQTPDLAGPLFQSVRLLENHFRRGEQCRSLLEASIARVFAPVREPE
jgi:hypothetical protein